MMNPPQVYEPPPLPHKKKQYRSPVPTEFKSGFDTFLSRRSEKKKKDSQEKKKKDSQEKREKDLAVFDLDEVLEQCLKKQVLSLTIVHGFLATNGTLHIKRFLEKWVKCKLV